MNCRLEGKAYFWGKKLGSHQRAFLSIFDQASRWVAKRVGEQFYPPFKTVWGKDFLNEKSVAKWVGNKQSEKSDRWLLNKNRTIGFFSLW